MIWKHKFVRKKFYFLQFIVQRFQSIAMGLITLDFWETGMLQSMLEVVYCIVAAKEWGKWRVWGPNIPCKAHLQWPSTNPHVSGRGSTASQQHHRLLATPSTQIFRQSSWGRKFRMNFSKWLGSCRTPMCKTVIELKKETEHERNLSVKSTFHPYRGPGSSSEHSCWVAYHYP